MNILLLDVDSKIPNLALMKISAHHKKLGDTIWLNTPREIPDKIYASCIFPKNKARCNGMLKMWGDITSEAGGSGISLDSRLPDHIEHIMPDYSLYGSDFSMGYTSRGCNRKCPWCIIPKKEGSIIEHAPIGEFLAPNHRNLVLLDNNFLASPRWEEKVGELIKLDVKVCFNQGLDIRLINSYSASVISRMKCYDDQFKKRRIYFAYDTPQVGSTVLDGIKILEDAGIKRGWLMFYVLVGFNTSYREDLERIELLIKEDVMPYVMPFNDRPDSYYPHLERWVNGRFYKIVKWENYNSGTSQKWIKEMG